MADSFNQQAVSGGEARSLLVPTSIVEQGLLSETSEAITCFTEQAFSARLQTYLINYVISVSGSYSVYS